MNKNISCWDCNYYDEYEVNDYTSEYYCSHDIENKMDTETGDVHPKTNCVMFETKRKITSDNKDCAVTQSEIATPKSDKSDFAKS